MATLDLDRLTDMERGRVAKHLSRLVRDHAGVVMTFGELYARPEYVGPESGRLPNGKPYYGLSKGDGRSTEVPRLVWIAAGGERGERCPDCLGTNGVHSTLHTRYGNGGGGNRPCPRDGQGS